MHKAPDGNDFLGELKLPQVPDSLDYKVSPEQIPEGILDITSIEGAGIVRVERENPYVVYIVSVQWRDSSPCSWTIYRRYSDFHNLFCTLRQEGLHNVIAIPPKTLLGNLSKEFVDKRAADLTLWLQAVSELVQSSHIDSFTQTYSTLKEFLTQNINDYDAPKGLIPYDINIDNDVINSTTTNTNDHLCPAMSPTCCVASSPLPTPPTPTPTPTPTSIPCTPLVCRKLGGRYSSSGEDEYYDYDSDGNVVNGDGVGDSDMTCSKERKQQQVSMDDFELIQVIGKGSFGKVTVVKKKSDNKIYAMKALQKSTILQKKQVERTITERRVLGFMDHPFIVKLHYAFQTSTKLCLVLDFASGGELFFHLSRLKRFSESMTRFYAAEIALALRALHDVGVAYRDLKPENILLDAEGHVKLADFGLAKEGVREVHVGAFSMCGTPEYLSPEVLDRQGHGTAVDWWNLGMVVYEMLTGLPPWYTEDRPTLFKRLRDAPLKFPGYISRRASSLISRLLNRDPKQRLGSGGWDEIRDHTFFDKIDWHAIYHKDVRSPLIPCVSASTRRAMAERNNGNNGDSGNSGNSGGNGNDHQYVDTTNFAKEFTRLSLDSSEEEDNNNDNHCHIINNSFNPSLSVGKKENLDVSEFLVEFPYGDNYRC